MTHTITTKEGKLFVGTEQLVIPNFEIIEFVANGANGSVFKAIDTHLSRQVAVKIWNKRGKPRAQHEISKLALINHPLFGVVYKYDQHLNHPFAIMEWIDGQTATRWLKTEPPLLSRIAVWNLYSKGLHVLYSSGRLHGDPHTDNFLLMPDENGVQSHFVPAEVRNNSRLAMKFVDTGTSIFWDKHDKFEHREREVVIETANRLLKDDLSVDTAIDLSQIQSHSRILESIDHLCTFQAALVLARAELAEHHRIDFDDDWFGDAHHHTQAWLPHFRRAVEAVSDAPIFNLDWVLATLKSGPFSIKKFFRAIASSVNFDDECLWDDPFKEGVIKKINRRYAANRSAYIAGQYKRSAIVC